MRVTPFLKGSMKKPFKLYHGRLNDFTFDPKRRVWEDGNKLLEFIV
jgi:hypothetical protein